MPDFQTGRCRWFRRAGRVRRFSCRPAAVVDVEFNAVVLLDELQRIVDDGQGFQPQEVHLDDPGILNHVAFILGDLASSNPWTYKRE